MKFQIEYYRKTETDKSVIGFFEVPDLGLRIFGLEPSRKTPVHAGHPCIPVGTYKVVRTLSPHLHYKTPELLDVPGRSDIRWHIGNAPKDVLGCIAVGLACGPPADWVSQSALAFARLMDVLNPVWDRGDEVWVTYHDPAV